MKPATQVLVRLFAFRFYRAHSGLFLFFFVTVIISFFFVNVLNQTHLTEEDRIRHNLLLTLTFISSPAFTVFIFIAWLIYMIKSWLYTAAQLRLPEHQFIFYSFNAQSKRRRFSQWLVVQAAIAIPLAVYALFALLIGIIYGHYFIPGVIFGYIAVLVTAGATLCLRFDRLFIDHNTVSWSMHLTRGWQKPFFTLPLYYLLHRQKITIAITKVLSAFVLATGILLLPENKGDSRIVGLLALGVTTAHAFTIYQMNLFSNSYLSFVKNFPYSSTRRLGMTISSSLLLISPELIWLAFHHNPWHFAQALVFSTGAITLFQTLLHQTSTTKQYLTRVFYVFIGFFLILLFNLLWIVAPLTLIAAVAGYRIQSNLQR